VSSCFGAIGEGYHVAIISIYSEDLHEEEKRRAQIIVNLVDAMSRYVSDFRSAASLFDHCLAPLERAWRIQDDNAVRMLHAWQLSPTISFDPRSRLQHLQRPTPSDFNIDASRLSRHGDGDLACGGCLRTYGTQPFCVPCSAT
jgi:hypothetical protein